MVINKLHTTQKEEESSSLKTQELKFVRRPDITPGLRLDLSIAGLGPAYRDGTIAELCTKYKVSHEFIYSLSRILRAEQKTLFGVNDLSPPSDLEKLLGSMRFFLEAKLETQGSLYGLSNLAGSWGIKYHSINFISQSLEVAGSLLPNTVSSPEPLRLSFLCDEVYSGEQAILVTLEAQSMTVLDIELLSDSLSAKDWEGRWQILEAGNITPYEVIKDQGNAMRVATRVLPPETAILADTFHATSYRLGIFHSRLIRQVDTAMEEEWKRKDYLGRGKSPEMQAKQLLKYEQAQARTLQAIDHLEWFESYYFRLIQQLRPFTSMGQVRDKARAQIVIGEALEALSFLPLKGLAKQLQHIEKLLSNGQLLRFLDKVPALYEKWREEVDPDALWLWMLYWQWWKKAFQTHCPKVQQYAKQEAQAAADLLEQYYQHQPAQYQMHKVNIFASLDKIVQASALVETFNSILKPFINSARGQVTQPLLNLVKFYHNHRIFQRGKRKGKAPIELLRGKTLDQSWIDLLMDKIKAAFKQHRCSSLKKLHERICKPEKGIIMPLSPKLSKKNVA